MDIISQLQEQVNQIAGLTFNTFGTLQRDAPSARLSQNYPEPPPNPTEDAASFPEQPKQMSVALVKAAKQFDALVAALPLSEGGEEAQLKRIAELQVYSTETTSIYTFYIKYFIIDEWSVNLSVNAQAENDAVGQELQKQLEAAEWELKLVQELFGQTTDNCLNLKKPD